MTHFLKSTFVFLLAAMLFIQCNNEQKTPGVTDSYKEVYNGDAGPGKGKNIVLIASDHEYRSEESLPALARILAKNYGFNCTVLWGLDDKGNILPGSSNLKGLSVLDNADLLVIFTRFLDLADEDMEHLNAYLEKGKPVIGLRTATHAFHNKDNPKWNHYDYRYEGPKTEWKHGFGPMVLGETWVDHYGTNHKQATRLIVEEAQKEHPIMRGVSNAWMQSGAYEVHPEQRGATVLAVGEVLNGMTADSPADTTKPKLPVAWVRDYTLPGGKTGKSFTTVHGASEDLLSEGFRRMLINASLWAIGMDEEIKPDNNIAFVGPYQPTTFNFDGYKANVKPSDLAGFESLIMPGQIVQLPKKEQ